MSFMHMVLFLSLIPIGAFQKSIGLIRSDFLPGINIQKLHNWQVELAFRSVPEVASIKNKLGVYI